MNKYFYYVLSAIFVMSLGMVVASCSDDDKNSSDNPGGGDDNEQTEAQYEQQQLGWTLITQLTDEGKAPEGWENKTFEPTIGSAVEGDPYTRVVATNTMSRLQLVSPNLPTIPRDSARTHLPMTFQSRASAS